MRSVLRSRWAPAAVAFLVPLLAATLVQIALPSSLKANESADYTAFYRPVAERLVAGEGVTTPDGRVADRYPPGYPVFLAAVLRLADLLHLSRSTLVTVFSILLHALGALLLFALVREYLRPRAACIGALAWGLSPIALWLTKQPNSELVFTVVMLGALVLYVPLLRIGSDRPGPTPTLARLAAVGALLGAASLIRPIAVVAVVPLAGLALVRARPARLSAMIVGLVVLMGTFLVVLAPWEAWVHSRTGQVLLLSSGSAPSVRDGLTFENGVPVGVRSLMDEAQGRQGELDSLGAIASFLRDQARARPVAVAELVAIKAGRSWFATDSERYELAILALQVPFLALAAAGLVRTWRRGPREWVWLAVLLVAAFWVMTIAVLSIVRYLSLAEMLLSPFAVLGLQALVIGLLPGIPTTWARPPWRAGRSTEPQVSGGVSAPVGQGPPATL